MTIAWSEELSVGNELIDLQHKNLVNRAALYADLINPLGTSDDPASGFYADLLHEVSLYAKGHFVAEERLMELAGYDGLSEHIVEHERFKKTLLDFLARSSTDKFSKRMFAKFLEDWFSNHVLRMDMQYKDAIGLISDLGNSQSGGEN